MQPVAKGGESRRPGDTLTSEDIALQRTRLLQEQPVDLSRDPSANQRVRSRRVDAPSRQQSGLPTETKYSAAQPRNMYASDIVQRTENLRQDPYHPAARSRQSGSKNSLSIERRTDPIVSRNSPPPPLSLPPTND